MSSFPGQKKKTFLTIPNKNHFRNQLWNKPINPAPGRWRQEDQRFRVVLDYIVIGLA